MSDSQTWARCLRIQLNADIMYLVPSYGTVPSRYHRYQFQVQVIICVSNQSAIDQKFPKLSSWVWQNSGETFYFLDCQFIIRTELRKSQMEELQRTRHRKRVSSFHIPSWPTTFTSPNRSTGSPTWKLCKPHPFGFITQAWFIKSLAIGNSLNVMRLCLPRRVGGGIESSTLSNHRVGSNGHKPSSLGAFQKMFHLINIKRYLSHSEHLWNSKCFRSCEPGNVDEDQIYIFLIHHNIVYQLFKRIIKYQFKG